MKDQDKSKNSSLAEEVPATQESTGTTGDAIPPQDMGPVAEAVARGVEAWVTDHIRNTKLSQNTEAYNVLVRALPALSESIVKEMQK